MCQEPRKNMCTVLVARHEPLRLAMPYRSSPPMKLHLFARSNVGLAAQSLTRSSKDSHLPSTTCKYQHDPSCPMPHALRAVRCGTLVRVVERNELLKLTGTRRTVPLAIINSAEQTCHQTFIMLTSHCHTMV